MLDLEEVHFYLNLEFQYKSKIKPLNGIRDFILMRRKVGKKKDFYHSRFLTLFRVVFFLVFFFFLYFFVFLFLFFRNMDFMMMNIHHPTTYTREGRPIPRCHLLTSPHVDWDPTTPPPNFHPPIPTPPILPPPIPSHPIPHPNQQSILLPPTGFGICFLKHNGNKPNYSKLSHTT